MREALLRAAAPSPALSVVQLLQLRLQQAVLPLLLFTYTHTHTHTRTLAQQQAQLGIATRSRLLQLVPPPDCLLLLLRRHACRPHIACHQRLLPMHAYRLLAPLQCDYRLLDSLQLGCRPPRYRLPGTTLQLTCLLPSGHKGLHHHLQRRLGAFLPLHCLLHPPMLLLILDWCLPVQDAAPVMLMLPATQILSRAMVMVMMMVVTTALTIAGVMMILPFQMLTTLMLCCVWQRQEGTPAPCIQ